MLSRQVIQLLEAFESPNVTSIDPDGSWPIVWERAQGVQVWDADGKEYLDLTAAFAVAAAGHANPRVVKAGQAQMARLLHAMGDVHPHARKAELARELSRITFERWGEGESKVQSPKSEVRSLRSKVQRVREVQDSPHEVRGPKADDAGLRGKTIFCNSGFEAVEAALKTAMLATGKRGVIAFTGAYHGLGYGALNATHRDFFRAPFLAQLGGFGHFAPFPCEWRREDGGPNPDALELTEQAIRRLFQQETIGAILVEPVQGRAGIRVPPPTFLPLLRQICDEHQALLVVDEIYTGFGRTGRWFACEHSRTIPDIICLGKALTGGFPLAACVGKAALMDAAWPKSQGEAIHTSTFLGHPVGCTMALAQIAEIQKRKLVQRSADLGDMLLAAFTKLLPPASVRLSADGLGLMAGLKLRLADGSPATALTLKLIKAMLHRGFILLPEGEHSNVIGFTPPLVITERQLKRTVEELGRQLKL